MDCKTIILLITSQSSPSFTEEEEEEEKKPPLSIFIQRTNESKFPSTTQERLEDNQSG